MNDTAHTDVRQQLEQIRRDLQSVKLSPITIQDGILNVVLITGAIDRVTKLLDGPGGVA